MIQHAWTVPCRMSITDQETNNVSLIGVLEELQIAPPHIRVDSLRGLVPMFDLVTLWTRANPETPEVGYARTCLLSSTNEEIGQQEAEIDLRQNRRVRSVSRFVGFPLVRAGIYYFRIQRREDQNAAWEEVARVPLDVAVDPSVLPPPNGQNRAAG
jgi:hypothetical protein